MSIAVVRSPSLVQSVSQPFAAAVAWEIADLITYCVNKRGIHPGAHVGVELVLWLAMIICTVFWGINGAFWDTYDYITSSYSFAHNGIAIAAVITEALSTIFHFTLFVWACVDTDRRRKMRYAEMAAMANQARMSMAAATIGGNTPYNYPPPPPGMAYQLVSAPRPNGQQPQVQGGTQQSAQYSQAPSQVLQQYDQRNSNGSPLLQ
ncbi:uncharacterized protein BDZ99DRAFT_12933 [Mytilinidion resinicola]|uniref:Uncharacterized protein n=1 Tax=Mytilinidion resinicola TaxID=574789 RepID=A0A6A6Z8E8_9PEZI|nr:uncharacterized protein BDZ99DRAFT_12933 [Mytilinidion resinicola]KAF2817290.1 hypothetical protein BDZ99DRAFT_12933 [Mytilinidion resinicola]